MSAERPVEELIGWEWFRGRWWDGHVSQARAEADDLADWLTDAWAGKFIQIRQCDAGWMVCVQPDRPRPRLDWVSGPTIRDALVAAVRAVCDERSEQ